MGKNTMLLYADAECYSNDCHLPPPSAERYCESSRCPLKARPLFPRNLTHATIALRSTHWYHQLIHLPHYQLIELDFALLCKDSESHCVQNADHGF